MGDASINSFVLADGSAILLLGVVLEADLANQPDGTLSRSHEVAEWITEAVAAGITFDVLKALGRRVVLRCRKTPTEEPGEESEADPASLVDAILRHLASVGHLEAVIEEVRRVDGQGWLVRGTCRAGTLTARADEAGCVIHLRIR